MTEIELKLAVEPGDASTLARCAPLASGRPRRTRMTSIYLDTPDCALAKREMALRLRREGSRWRQTLKAGASGTGGLHARSEWEFAATGSRIDLSLFAETPLAKLPQARKLHDRLQPAFRVDFIRTAWRIRHASGMLEVAYDAGSVSSDARNEPISELEIECVEGSADAAFELAARLLDEIRLRPSAVSKAQRGYRLFKRQALAPAKAIRVRLVAGMTSLAAARALVAASLSQLQANEEGLLGSDDPEFVHQARVALRRMRSALRMFRDVIGTDRGKAWRDAFGEAARALGVARDWDVFATETLPRLLPARAQAKLARKLAASAQAQRMRAREGAREAIRSRQYARAILDLAHWLSQAQDAEGAKEEALERFAAKLIRKRHKRLVAGARRLAELPAEERHRVRIDAKRLRYVVDGLACVFDGRKVGAYVDCLIGLQDELGKANDAATALHLIEKLDPPESFAERARQQLRERIGGDSKALEALAQRLAHHEAFWQH